MATTETAAHDRERYAQARARGTARADEASAVVTARYDSEADVIELSFAGGGSMSIPRTLVADLENAPQTTLDSIVVSPAGDAVAWPSLDVDVYVPGLVEHAFGTRLFAAATGRRGGRRRSKPKAAAQGQ